LPDLRLYGLDLRENRIVTLLLIDFHAFLFYNKVLLLNFLRNFSFKLLNFSSLPQSLIFEVLNTLFLQFAMKILQHVIVVAICEFRVQKNLTLQFFFVIHNGVLHCALAFILTQVSPGRLYAWNGPLIYRLSICLAKFKEHLSCYVAIIENLGLHSFVNPLSQIFHLFNKLWPKSLILKLLERLKITFFLRRANHGIAISVLKKVKDQSPYSVLFLNVVR
jgi:hypothetical protein